jgi:hypothetical protein
MAKKGTKRMTLAQLKEKLARPIARKITPKHGITKVHSPKKKYIREKTKWTE